jgi:UDP-glucuronate decarboxylase
MTSILGTYNLLNLATENAARILHTSTSEVYGNPQISPQSEEYWGYVNPYGVRSCYDEGKRGAETLLHDFKKAHGVDTRIARVFNTYGPNMSIDDGRVVSNFIVQALTGSPITVYGDGSQIRSLCYVSDLVEGLIKLFFSDYEDGPINLGNPQPITMIALAREIIDLTDSQSEIIFKTLPDDDPMTRTPDISKAMQILEWKPVVGREVGLKKAINFFTDELKMGLN